MGFDTALAPKIRPQRTGHRRLGQLGAGLLCLTLAACAAPTKGDRGTIGYVQGFLGGVVSDEPHATVIGRDVLSAGGTAADAAVAVGLALAVTLPSSASLGGGGVCVVHDHKTATTETLDFLARPSLADPSLADPSQAGAPRPSAVPGLPRGLYALFAKYGALRWEELVAPAERLARFGTPVSRALAHDLAQVGIALIQDPDARRIFAAADGSRVLAEGEFLSQVDLAGLLGRLRARGPGDFYSGQFARPMVEAAIGAGGTLSIEDLRDYRPQWLGTMAVPFGVHTAHFAPPPAAAGAVAAQIFAMLADHDRFEDADSATRAHLLAEASERAFVDRDRWLRADDTSSVVAADLVAPARIDSLIADYRPTAHTVPAAGATPQPENPAATGFVVIDRTGSAVSCALTLNNLFGTGRVAPGTGVVLAARPGQAGRGPRSLGPMLAIKHHVNEFVFAAAASGGIAAPAALVRVAAGPLLAGESLTEAIAAKRVHHGAAPDLTYVEQGLDPAVQQALRQRGHHIGLTEQLGWVHAISCPGGVPPQPETCLARSDPRSFGLAVGAAE